MYQKKIKNSTGLKNVVLSHVISYKPLSIDKIRIRKFSVTQKPTLLSKKTIF